MICNEPRLDRRADRLELRLVGFRQLPDGGRHCLKLRLLRIGKLLDREVAPAPEVITSSAEAAVRWRSRSPASTGPRSARICDAVNEDLVSESVNLIDENSRANQA